MEKIATSVGEDIKVRSRVVEKGKVFLLTFLAIRRLPFFALGSFVACLDPCRDEILQGASMYM